MKKKTTIINKLRIPRGLFIAILLIGGFYVVLSQPYRKLKAINPEQVTSFKIYTRISKPAGSLVEFNMPNPLIEDFFHALQDFRFRLPGRHTVISFEHNWFLEVSTRGTIIQMICSIPSHKPNVVIARFGEYSSWIEMDYGEFESKLLFQWYQKYSHLWLHPPENGKQ